MVDMHCDLPYIQQIGHILKMSCNVTSVMLNVMLHVRNMHHLWTLLIIHPEMTDICK